MENRNHLHENGGFAENKEKRMKLTTVLFDLDGTLLPMDMDAFIKYYFGLLAKKLAPVGYPQEALIQAIWQGTEAMVRNDGSMTNEEAFWRSFTARFGENARKDEPIFEEYYRNEFQTVKAACGFTPMAKQTLELCHSLGLRTALATNPLFPAIATQSRIRWAGLQEADFEIYTTYENSRYCKPNLSYYRQVLDTLGVCPEECLMVGNDVDEDMVAEQLGMRVFLLTPCLINKSGRDISQFPNGDFPELWNYLKEAVK